MKKQHVQLELYYPKNTYDRLARREMKAVLTHFNERFYDIYPEALKGQSNVTVDYYPRTHSRHYDVQRAIKLCKSQKFRRKDILKIEENLNLQYIIEEQMNFYSGEIKKARYTKDMLSQEVYTSFYPQLYEERMKILDEVEKHSVATIGKLEGERRICEKAIYDLLYQNHDFWGNASRLIGGMITDSLKRVANVIDQSVGRKW